MPDYIVTAKDGSRYLAHYGVKGMHWGEWNEETRARRMGYRDKKIAKIDKKLSKDLSIQKREKLENKKKYLNELKTPGSTDISSRYLAKKRLLNAIIGGASGLSLARDITATPLAAVGLATLSATLPAGMAVSAPYAAVKLGSIAVGSALGVAVDYKIARTSLAKAKDIDMTLTKRTKESQLKKK